MILTETPYPVQLKSLTWFNTCSFLSPSSLPNRTHNDPVVPTTLQSALLNAANLIPTTHSTQIDDSNDGRGLVVMGQDGPLRPYYLLTSSTLIPPIPATSVNQGEADELWERVYSQTSLTDIENNKSAYFPPIRIPSKILCECELDRPLLLRVLSHRGSSAPEPVGQSRTTLRHLLQWPKRLSPEQLEGQEAKRDCSVTRSTDAHHNPQLRTPSHHANDTLMLGSTSSTRPPSGTFLASGPLASNSSIAATTGSLPTSHPRPDTPSLSRLSHSITSTSSVASVPVPTKARATLFDEEAYRSVLEDHLQFITLIGAQGDRTGGQVYICRAQLLVSLYPDTIGTTAVSVQKLFTEAGLTDEFFLTQSKASSTTISSTQSSGSTSNVFHPTLSTSSPPANPMRDLLTLSQFVASKPKLPRFGLVFVARVYANLVHSSWRCRPYFEIYTLLSNDDEFRLSAQGTDLQTKRTSGQHREIQGSVKEEKDGATKTPPRPNRPSSSPPFENSNTTSNNSPISPPGGASPPQSTRRSSVVALEEGTALSRSPPLKTRGSTTSLASTDVSHGIDMPQDARNIIAGGGPDWKPNCKTLDAEGKTWTLMYRSEVANGGTSTIEPVWSTTSLKLDMLCRRKTNRAIMICVYHRAGPNDEAGTLIGRCFTSLKKLLHQPKKKVHVYVCFICSFDNIRVPGSLSTSTSNVLTHDYPICSVSLLSLFLPSLPISYPFRQNILCVQHRLQAKVVGYHLVHSHRCRVLPLHLFTMLFSHKAHVLLVLLSILS